MNVSKRKLLVSYNKVLIYKSTSLFSLLQLLQRGKNQEKRLQDELRNIQGNAALVEELLAWLTDAQVLLTTKERDPIPEDIKVVEDLYKEHMVRGGM
jgi:hypothetical protein